MAELLLKEEEVNASISFGRVSTTDGDMTQIQLFIEQRGLYEGLTIFSRQNRAQQLNNIFQELR